MVRVQIVLRIFETALVPLCKYKIELILSFHARLVFFYFIMVSLLAPD